MRAEASAWQPCDRGVALLQVPLHPHCKCGRVLGKIFQKCGWSRARIAKVWQSAQDDCQKATARSPVSRQLAAHKEVHLEAATMVHTLPVCSCSDCVIIRAHDILTNLSVGPTRPRISFLLLLPPPFSDLVVVTHVGCAHSTGG